MHAGQICFQQNPALNKAMPSQLHLGALEMNNLLQVEVKSFAQGHLADCY